MPGAKVFVPLRVTVTALPGEIGLAEKETEVPVGFPVAASVMELLNPPATIVANVIDMLAGAGQGATSGAGVLNV